MPQPTADPPGWAPELNVQTGSRDLTLRGDSQYRIGRDPKAAIALSDGRVSWQHALLRLVDGTWVLQDTGSRNGIWVAGERAGRIEIRGLLVARFGGPDDGVAVRLQPRPRPGLTPAALAGQMLPFILAALRADGDAVLAKPRESLISAATLGRAWLQEIFGRRREGEPLPPALTEAIGQPGNAGSGTALTEEVRVALVNNDRLAWATAYVLDTRPDLGRPTLARPANRAGAVVERRGALPGTSEACGPRRRGIAGWITPRRGRSPSSGSGTGTRTTSTRCLSTSPTLLSSPHRWRCASSAATG